jgi:hypothetical protein
MMAGCLPLERMAGGGVTLRERSGGAGKQLSPTCAIRPGGGGRRAPGRSSCSQAVAGFIPKVVKALRPALRRCCERTAAVMARWGMAVGGEEISSVREREHEALRLGFVVRLVKILGQGCWAGAYLGKGANFQTSMIYTTPIFKTSMK